MAQGQGDGTAGGRGQVTAGHLRPQSDNTKTAHSFLALETFPASSEAIAVMDCVAQTGLLPVWVSFTLRDEQCLAGGETIAQAVKAVINHQLARLNTMIQQLGEIWGINIFREKRLLAIGFNCSCPSLITGALQEARKAAGSKIPFVVYPNSGERWERGHWSKPEQEVAWLDLIPAWVQLGAVIVGGCCRVTDEAMPVIKAQIVRALTK